MINKNYFTLITVNYKKIYIIIWSCIVEPVAFYDNRY